MTNRDRFPKRRGLTTAANGRARLLAPKARAQAQAEQQPKATPHLARPPAAPDCKPVSLVNRTATQCAFPLWDQERPDADSPYCGASVTLDESYCRFHQRIMYRPRETIAKRAA